MFIRLWRAGKSARGWQVATLWQWQGNVKAQIPNAKSNPKLKCQIFWPLAFDIHLTFGF
jgi:hypothetical protein